MQFAERGAMRGRVPPGILGDAESLGLIPYSIFYGHSNFSEGGTEVKVPKKRGACSLKLESLSNNSENGDVSYLTSLIFCG